MNLGPKHGISESLHGITNTLRDKYADIFILPSDSEKCEALQGLQKERPELDIQQQYNLYCLLRREIASEKEIWDKLKEKRALTFSYKTRDDAQEQLPLSALSTSAHSSDDCLVRSPAFDEEKKASGSEEKKVSGSESLRLGR